MHVSLSNGEIPTPIPTHDFYSAKVATDFNGLRLKWVMNGYKTHYQHYTKTIAIHSPFPVGIGLGVEIG